MDRRVRGVARSERGAGDWRETRGERADRGPFTPVRGTSHCGGRGAQTDTQLELGHLTDVYFVCVVEYV